MLLQRSLDIASMLVTAAGLGVGALVLARTGRVSLALACLMELLTAAGLLRLAAALTLSRVLAAGGVLLVRRLATAGLRGPVPSAAALERLGRLPRLVVPADSADAPS